MSQREFERAVTSDVAIGAVTVVGLMVMATLAPDWVVGLVVIGLIPALLLAWVVLAVAVAVIDGLSHRWDTKPSPEGVADVLAAQPDSAMTPVAADVAAPGPVLSRFGRTDLPTPWVDYAWATVLASERSWDRTRPGR